MTNRATLNPPGGGIAEVVGELGHRWTAHSRRCLDCQQLPDTKMPCRLNERELGILWLRDGRGDGRRWSGEEIGKLFGVTRSRIYQLERRARAKVAAGCELRQPDRQYL